ncbi:MAG: ABC transporter, partial [Limnohabitans sp.]|nr:ABC transporter [Limnohabitans sp.]
MSSEENVSAWLEVDLDAGLYFARGLMVLTHRRLIWCAPGSEKTWHSLDIQPDWQLELSDHAGVGHLRLREAAQQIADWRFTLGRNLQATALLACFNKQQAGQGDTPGQSWCQVCHAPLKDAEDTCRSCDLVQDEA